MSKDHFVPQLILKRFKKPDGVLWYYDSARPHKGVEERNPAKIFYQRNFSNSSDGEYTVETQFRDKIETPLNGLLDTLLPKIRLGFEPNLSTDHIALLVHYLYYQLKRRPEVVTDVLDRKTFGPIAYKDEAEKKAVQYVEGILESELKEDKDFIHDLRLQILTHKNQDLIDLMVWTGAWFLRSTANEAFCITSNPIKGHLVNSVNAGGQILNIQTLLVPVSHDIAICFGPPWLSGTIQVIATDANVRRINTDNWSQSNKIAGPDKRQIEKIVG